MKKNPHYFYAVKLPIEIKLRLQEICSQLKENFPFKNWVHHEDYHITLAFLGNANREQLEASIHFVQQALALQDSFSLTINQLGTFGKSDSPRIFWAGLEKEAHLFRTREHVFHACRKADFILETRPFHPHITLARKWLGSSSFEHDLLKKIETLHFEAKEVVLYETHLEKVPKYEVKQTFLLNKVG